MTKEQELTLKKNRNSLDSMQLKIHNQMARTLSRFEEPEYAKLFLTSLGTLLKSENNIARIKKIELFDKLNITDADRHTRYFRLLDKMSEKTKYDITLDKDTQIAGRIIYKIKRTRSEYHVYFDEDIAPILKELDGQYTLLYIDSIMKFKSSCSITLYNYLLSWHNKNYKINKQWLSTKQLKELFGLSEDDYVKSSGKFDRYNFEKYTIQKAVDEITQAGYMYIRWYKAKDKLTKKVIAYVFEFKVIDHDKEKENGIEFTKVKYGKVDDVIITDEDELNIIPTSWYAEVIEPIVRGQTTIDDFLEEPAGKVEDVEYNTDIDIETLKEATKNEFSESELELLDHLLTFYSSDYNTKTDFLRESYLKMNSQKPKHRFNYLKTIIKNATTNNKNEEVEEEQYSIFNGPVKEKESEEEYDELRKLMSEI